MEYKRLTMEKEYGCCLCHDRKCKKPNLYCKDRLECETYNRLAELEDKIEQGTLIELPCKVGDDVYFVAQNEEDWVMEIGYVFSISIDEEGIWIACRYSNGLPYWHNIKDSDVFFNANKANERLKELQNG